MFHFTGKCFSLSEENLFWTINICWDLGFEMRSIQTYFMDFREAINEVCLISARGYFIWSLCLHLIAIIWNWIVICLCCLLFCGSLSGAAMILLICWTKQVIIIRSVKRERGRRVVDKHGHFLFYFYILCGKI